MRKILALPKKQKKRAIIREQINIRRKVLGQKVNVPFSYKRKQRSLSDIVKEFSAHLNDVPAASTSTSTRDYSSESLVGLTVLKLTDKTSGLLDLL